MLFVIDSEDLKQFNKGVPGNKLEKAFRQIVKRLNKKEQAEANKKGFVLNQDWRKEVVTRTLIPQIIDASEELKEALDQVDPKILYIEVR